MFTFSFSSAFAKVAYQDDATEYMMQMSDYLYHDYEWLTSTEHGQGTVGVTESEKEEQVWELEDMLAGLNKYSARLVTYEVTDTNVVTDTDAAVVYAGANLTNAISLVTKTIDSVKAVKTSQELYSVMNKFWSNLDDIDDVSEGPALTTEAVKLTLDAGTYLLPGYGYYSSDDLANYVIETEGEHGYADGKIYAWMLDNDYDTAKLMTGSAAAKALEEALVLIATATNVANIYALTDNNCPTADGYVALQTAKSLDKKIGDVNYQDFDAVCALYDQVDEFTTKYGDGSVVNSDSVNDLMDKADTMYANALRLYKSANFEADKKAIDKIKVSAAVENKETLVAFAEKLLAFEEKYGEDVYGNEAKYLSKLSKLCRAFYGEGLTDEDYTSELVGGNTVYTVKYAAPDYDLSKYFNKLAKTAYEAVYDAKVVLAVSLPENLRTADKANFEAYANAYDAYKAEILKDAYEGCGYYAWYDDEAYILAGKANLGLLKDKVDNDDVNAQQLLNNATVKVTTKALGNKKISVNAKVDADSFKAVLAAAGSGATVEYKYYYKKAANSTYKFTKTKKVNYITYTKKSLKKGTKYNFRVGVVVKDADGKVVATKSYKASGLGIRVCK